MSQSIFLAAGEVAELLGTSLKWVYAHQDEIPGKIKIAGLIRWNREQLLESLKEQSNSSAYRCRKAATTHCAGRDEHKDPHNLLVF